MLTPEPMYLVWLAGFIDGEGCFNISKTTAPQSRGYSVQFILVNTNEAVIREAYAQLGCGQVVSYQQRNGRARPAFRWYALGDAARHITRLVRPYLRLKGPQADLILSFPCPPRGRRGAPVPQEIRDEQERVRDALCALNQRGRHALMEIPDA